MGFSDCRGRGTGCEQAFGDLAEFCFRYRVHGVLIKANYPNAAQLILETMSLDYNETVMAAAGTQAEEILEQALKRGDYILIIEGAIPTKKGYGMIARREMLDIGKEFAAKAKAIIAVGSCATGVECLRVIPTLLGSRGWMMPWALTPSISIFARSTRGFWLRRLWISFSPARCLNATALVGQKFFTARRFTINANVALTLRPGGMSSALAATKRNWVIACTKSAAKGR